MALTETQIKTDIQNVVKFYDQIRLFGAVNSGTLGSQAVTNVITQQGVCTSAFLGDWLEKKGTALQSTRDSIASALLGAGSVLRWTLRDYGQYLNVPETDPVGILGRVYDDYHANNKRICSRGFTFGSPSAGGSNVGNGVVFRLNVDENGYVLENQVADAKTAECKFDANNGASKWEEVFEVRAGVAAKDQLAITGSGKKTNISGISARQSASLIRNPSFSQTTPAGPSTSLTGITNWTSSVAISTTYYDSIGGTGVNGYYRDFPGDTTPLALRLKPGGDLVLSQSLESNRSAFRDDVPYLVQLAWRRKGSATGTLTLRLGDESVSVSVASGTNDVWNVLRFSGTQCWFKNFDKAGLSVSIETSSLAVSNVDVDDLLIVPMTKFDGSWYAFVGTPATGAPSQWLKFDTFTWTDTELGEGHGIIQKIMCWRSFGDYLPAIPKAPSSACVAALAGAGAGNVDNGIHYYRVTFVDVNGVESGLSASDDATVVDKTSDGKVSLTSIPTGPANTASRKVYRTVAAAADSVGNFKLLTTVADNVTTTYTDNTADGSLGATASAVVQAGITLADPS